MGHEAYSCDLQPPDDGSPFHIMGDAIAAAYGEEWDLMIGHPECTYLANSSSGHLYNGRRFENGANPERWARLGAAASFFLTLWNAPIDRVALENPIMLGHPKRIFGIPPPAQVIQPWMFGHPETKATCLWLRNLPKLSATYNVKEQMDRLPDNQRQRIHYMPPSKDRKKERSRTFTGIAQAMASQWGNI